MAPGDGSEALDERARRWLWLETYRDDPRVIQWLMANKPPFGWAPKENAEFAYDNMPDVKEWEL